MKCGSSGPSFCVRPWFQLFKAWGERGLRATLYLRRAEGVHADLVRCAESNIRLLSVLNCGSSATLPRDAGHDTRADDRFGADFFLGASAKLSSRSKTLESPAD